MLEKKWTSSSWQKLAAILSLSFSMMYTVILFTPLDLYLHNPTDFVVSWKFFAPALFGVALICSIALSVVLFMMWYKKTMLGVALLLLCALFFTFIRFAYQQFLSMYIYIVGLIVCVIIIWILLTRLLREKAVDAALLVLWGVYVISYIQTLFLNGGMTLITGDKAEYNGQIINILLWVIVSLLPLCLWIVFKIKNKAFHYEKALIFTAFLISGMQIAGLVSSAVFADLPIGFDENTDEKFFSYESAIHFSPVENICVFLLDRLDVTYMTEVLETYPELYKQLSGFTLYQNNIAEFTGTFPSVTTILTQHYYREGLTFDEYWEEAWAQHTVIDTLKENGFITNLFIDILSTYGDVKQIQGRTDNLKSVEIRIYMKGMLDAAGRLSLGRLSPYYLKNFFLGPIDSAFGNNFFRMNNDGSHVVQRPGINVTSDLDFYEFILQNDFSVDSEKKVFNFIHLNCSHADWDKAVTTGGYHFDAKSGIIKHGGNYIDSTRACFEILNSYFEQMRNIGVYDNSTIILLADHGATNPYSEKKAVTTCLFIKPQGGHESLTINTEAELSNQYFGASILEAAQLSLSDLSVSFFDVIGGAPPPIRSFYSYSSWWGAREGAQMIKLNGIYEINGDASDFENWRFIKK